MRSLRGNSITGEKGEIKKLKSLFPYLLPYKKYLIYAIIALTISSSSVLALGKGLGYVIDKGLRDSNDNLFNAALIAMFCVTMLLALGTYARFYFITYVGERVIADIRRDIYAHILTLSSDFFEKTKPGDILSRITTDTTVLQLVIGSSISITLRNVILFIAGSALLIHTSPKLALAMSIVVPVVILPIIIIGKKLRIISNRYQEKVAVISSHAEETIHGIKTIQSYVREDLENQYFLNHIKESIDTAIDRISLRALLTAVVILFVFGAVGFVLWVGGHDLIKGDITAGQLSSFIIYAIVVAGSVGALSDFYGDLQRSAGAAERISDLLGTKSSILNNGTITLANNLKGNIEFKNVSFAYPSNLNKLALKNFNLNIKSGQTIALVGPSGAGKSTIFQMLLRFYNIQRGAVFIDDNDISLINLKELRGLFGLVPQDPIIFSNSVYENILFGNPAASKEDVYKAAHLAAATSFIEDLPNGFDSVLGEKGVRLSGGEKQRVAIARTFLKDPKILLLDEATSSLDSANEKLVLKALDNLRANRTTIVIAHRLSTVKNADRIIVIDKGEIQEEGSHEELIKLNGLYAKLVKIQFSS
jgi:ATP-binding cassette subfamily B protein